MSGHTGRKTNRDANKVFKRPFSRAFNLSVRRRMVNFDRWQPSCSRVVKIALLGGLFGPLMSLRGLISRGLPFYRLLQQAVATDAVTYWDVVYERRPRKKSR
jgi:hypothetical protein